MILGIDVGGTHTDAVLIEDLEIKKKAKTTTNEKNLIDTLLGTITDLLRGENISKLKRVVLSTTISTNAIVQDKTSRVGLILISGPGIAPSLLKIHDPAYFVSGYVNHRGVEIAKIDPSEIEWIGKELERDSIAHLAVAGKFSIRNPIQELKIRNILDNRFTHISLGHRLSGNLNFPRRISTTFLNAAIWELYSGFVRQVTDSLRQWGLSVPTYILKADGGTMEISHSVDFPVQTILSGPAASIMGILSMYDRREDAIALDIGGTTTDISLFADGVPLLENVGVTIHGHKTLIRGLHTKSIGIGGDSKVKYEQERIHVGPEREGPAAAFGGPYPTPTDAFIVAGVTSAGDREKATRAVADIARKMNVSVSEAAEAIIDTACREISSHVLSMIEELNNKPLYTIHEILEDKKLRPRSLYIVGGPAKAFSPRLEKLLACPAYIPEHAEVANAIGAALARTTAELTLLADTERRTLIIGEEGLQMTIPPGFSRKDAFTIGEEKLREITMRMGAKSDELDIEVIEEQEFNMVRDFRTTGKNIRLKLQVKPGLIAGYTRGKVVL